METASVLEQLICREATGDADFARQTGLTKQALFEKKRKSLSLKMLRELAEKFGYGVELVLHPLADEANPYAHQLSVARAALIAAQTPDVMDDEPNPEETAHQNAVMAAIDALEKSPFAPKN